jgi:type II secretory pathway component PulF
MLLTWMAKPPSAGVAMPNISWAFAFISAFAYGWVAILVILVGLAFIAVNVLWIIQAGERVSRNSTSA